MAFDLTGIELSEEDKAKIIAAHNAEIKGLKDNNTKLKGEQIDIKSQLDVLEKKLNGADLDQIKDIIKASKKDKYNELMKAGQFDEAIEQKVNAGISAIQAQLDQVIKEKENIQSEYDKTLSENEAMFIKNEITNGATKIKDLHKDAISDLLLRATGTWKRVEGQLKAFNGDEQIFKDGKPLSVVDWIESLRENHANYFNTAQGIGAPGSGGGSSDISRFFDRNNKDYNVTKQAEIAKTNPEQYNQLSSRNN